MSLSLFEAAREVADRPALIVGRRVITFAELRERVLALGAWLGERGVTAERALPVAVVADGSVSFFELAHALIALGVPIALLHPRFSAEQRRQALELLFPARVLDPPSDPALPGPRGPEPSPLPDDERPLAILFSSGSTGDPKGVVLSRRAFRASAAASAEHLGFQVDERWLLSLPTAHVGGFSVITRCLLGRGAVILPETPFSGTSADPAALLRAARDGRATSMSLVPTQLHALVERRMKPPASLRRVLLGGAPATSELLQSARDLGWPVLPSYGLTEACSQVATARPGRPPRSGVGPPLPGVGLRIADGEIQVFGPTLLSGYLRRPTGLVPALDADGWFHTGDLGSFDDDQNLVVQGRAADVIITGGEKVAAAKVERCALEHPDVLEACVLGLPDARWGQRVVIVVVSKAKADSAVVRAALETRLRSELDALFCERLANFERPRAYLFEKALARGPSGKVDRPHLLSWASTQLATDLKPETRKPEA